MSLAEPFTVERHEAFLAAVVVGDVARAESLVRSLLAEQIPPLAIMTGLVAATQRRIGDLWATDELSVAQEHAATAVSESVIGLLAAATRPGSGTDRATHAGARSRSDGPVLVACVEQEWHALPALILTELLRADGLSVTYLGANSSSGQLLRHIDETGPAAVALSCSLGASLPRARRQIEAIRETGTPVIVGGAAFDPAGRRARALGATGFTANGADAAAALRALPRAVPPAPALTHAGAEEAMLVNADRERLAAHATELLRPAGGAAAGSARWDEIAADQMPYLIGCVAGALLTQDRTVADDAVAWVADVLAVRGAPATVAEQVRRSLAGATSELPHAHALLR